MGANKNAESESIILYGDLSRELPRQRSKVVRIFTSSTFTDTSTERNALMRDTYPRLKDYCKSRYGLEFQVIDMRWGVRDEATDDHMTSQLCMAEIEACQRLSVGPNFVTFLCQKYGYRPFPPKIEGVEFKTLRDTLVDKGEPIGTLDAWFVRDDNCVPHVYILQPISSKLPYFSRHDEPEKRREHQGEWWATFELLQGQLRLAAKEAETRGLLTSDQAKKYRISVTHDEIDHGILTEMSDKQEHCLCFIRKFSDLESKCDAKEAAKFMDVNAGQVDGDAQELLSELRDKRVAEVLPPSNIILTELGEWTKDGVSLENARHEEYIRGFLEVFFTKMVGMIDGGVLKEKAASLDDPMHQEIMQHLFFCGTKCVGFQGREDVIGEVRGYVVQRAGAVGESGVPMVLHGDSGSGKTSVMAKCASLVKQAWLPGTNSAMMLRFLGTSPNTSSIQRVLTMLCKHVIQIYNEADIQIPTEYNQLVTTFAKVLKLASAEKPLVVFLDSLDQLSTEYGAHRMAWLPKKLPPHVALVVSTLPRVHGILEKLKERLPSTALYVQVAPFSQDESTAILKSWLATAQKGVMSSQLDLIDKAVAECSLPLFLKLVFDQATQWRSYHLPEDCILKPSIPGMINLIFERLEDYHGQILVSRALAYITLSPNGLTETELDDLLSLDDDVLNDVYQFWMPPVRRIPPSLWTRVRNDLSSYLVDRDSDGVTVIYWYHRQFIETARQRYLSDVNLTKMLHKTCSEYFSGTWSEGRQKPCKYSTLQVERFGVPAEAEEDRKVSSQPLTFSGPQDGGGDNVIFNLRKLTQLPFHLTEAEDWDVLKSSALCNFDFLLSKAKALSMQDVLADFYKVEEKTSDTELSILLAALRLSSSVIANDPDQLAPEIIGRLKDASDKFPTLKSLLEQAADRGCRTHPMLPISTCQQPPGGMLLTSLEGHTDVVVALAITSDSRWAVTGSKDNTVRIWLVENGTLVHTLTGHRESVYGIEITPDDQSCLTYSHQGEYMKSGKICVWNMETGDLTHRLKGHTGKGSTNVAISQDGKYAVSGLQTKLSYDDDDEDTDYEEDEVVTIAKRKHKEETMEVVKRKEREWDDDQYEGDEKYAVIIWNLETGQVIHWLCKHTGEIKGVLTTEIDDRQIAISFSQDHTLILWDMLNGQLIRQMTDSMDFPIWKVALSEDKRQLAVHGCEVAIHSFPDCEFLGNSEDPVSSSTVESMYISRDNSRVISGHCCGALRMYGTGEGTERELLKRQEYFERDGAITSLAVTADEKYVIATSGKNEAIVVNFDTFEVEAKLPHILTVTKAAVTLDGTKALTASEDKNVRVWDLGKVGKQDSAEDVELTLSKHDNYVYAVETLHSDDKIITTGNDGTIRMWDVQDGRMVKSVQDPGENSCYSVSISSNDTFMVGASSNSWYVLSLPDFEVKNVFRERQATPGLCVITPDDKRVVGALGQPKFQIRIYDLATGQTLQIVKLRSTSLHMLSSGVFVNNYEIGLYDSSGKTKILQLINSISGQVIAELCHGDRVLTYDVSGDEKWLIAGCSNNSVDLWELGSGSHVISLKGHKTRVKSVAFSPDGTLAASGADDGDVCIWDVRSQSLKHSMPQAHESKIGQVIFSPDNRLLVSSAEDDNYIQVWDVQSGQHRMKFYTYAKAGAIVMSVRCNTVVVTLKDGRVAFLKFSSLSGASPPDRGAGQVQTSHQQPRNAGGRPTKAAAPSNPPGVAGGQSPKPRSRARARNSGVCGLL